MGRAERCPTTGGVRLAVSWGEPLGGTGVDHFYLPAGQPGECRLPTRSQAFLKSTCKAALCPQVGQRCLGCTLRTNTLSISDQVPPPSAVQMCCMWTLSLWWMASQSSIAQCTGGGAELRCSRGWQMQAVDAPIGACCCEISR